MACAWWRSSSWRHLPPVEAISAPGKGRGPEGDAQHDRAREIGPCKRIARPSLHPFPGVPDEMPYAAEHVVDERKTVAKKHDPAGNGPENRARPIVSGLARSGGDQQEHEQNRSEIERAPRDAMRDRHHHGDRPAIHLKMGRKGA